MSEIFKELHLFVDGKYVKANGYKIGNKGTLISYKNNKIRRGTYYLLLLLNYIYSYQFFYPLIMRL